MSEMRWNPVLQEWVVTATHRQDRTFLPPSGYCPLCPTKEGGFPTEVPRQSYDFVVFENKFPSLSKKPPLPAIAASDLYPVKEANGVCEVVLYSEEHTGTLADLPPARVAQLIGVWRDRYEDLGSRKEIDYVFIFENKGEAIGVTIHHPHGQIYAFSHLPPKIKREIESERSHYDKTGRCLHCDIIKEEESIAQRLVCRTEHFVAFVPFYARYPYEVHIYAREHRSSLSDLSPVEERDMARILLTVLRKYDRLWGFSMPYMMVMHQRPTSGGSWPGSHLHIEFYPPMRTAEKMKYLAGCESGAGTYVNDTLPEEKAEELRKILVDPEN